MKKLILIILFSFVLPILLFSQTLNNSKIRKKKNKTAPPGTVWLKDDLYIDETEITNFNYIEYLNQIKVKFGISSDEYQKALPDTLVWRVQLAYSEPYIEYYFRHQRFHEFPLVGVSPEQAINFCKWRSERVMEYMMIKWKILSFEELEDEQSRTKIDSLLKNFKPRIKYRLPTEEEWMIAASGYLENAIFPWEGTSMIDKNDILRANVKVNPINYEIAHMNNYDFLMNTASYDPNSIGIYDMAGNVAEIVMNSKDINDGFCIKGGSWQQAGFHAMIKMKDNYFTARKYIGFRCICEVEY